MMMWSYGRRSKKLGLEFAEIFGPLNVNYKEICIYTHSTNIVFRNRKVTNVEANIESEFIEFSEILHKLFKEGLCLTFLKKHKVFYIYFQNSIFKVQHVEK